MGESVPMPVRIYTSFEEVPHDVQHRLSYPLQPQFFLSFDWFFLLFATSLYQTLSPRIYVLTDDQGETLGALFCGVARGGKGRRLLSLTNFYTLEYSASVVQGPAAKHAIVRQLVAAVAAER